MGHGLLRRSLNSGFTRDSLDASAQISESEKMHRNGGLTRFRSPSDSVSAHRLHTRDGEFDPEKRARAGSKNNLRRLARARLMSRRQSEH